VLCSAWKTDHFKLSNNTILPFIQPDNSYLRRKQQSNWMGFTYPIPDRWRMCTISYSIPRWRTAISGGQCRSSNMIYYAEMHRQTFEKLTWLKGTYYTENPSIRFMFVTFQYYCICWMSKLKVCSYSVHSYSCYIYLFICLVLSFLFLFC
jgi:hypothetical protein